MSHPELGPDEFPVFPPLGGLNWPSYLLQALLTLRELGVPEENIRLIPTLGHFAQPEVLETGTPSDDPADDPDEGMPDAAPWEMRHPRGPRYDSATERLTLQRVPDPRALYPRLGVNVRADSAGEDPAEEMPVGRLAHFLDILMADPPGALPPGEAGQRADETPLGKLTRQIAALFPELTDVLPEKVRGDLRAFLAALEAALQVSAEDTVRAETLLLRTLETLRLPRDASRIDALPGAFVSLLPRQGTAATDHLRSWGDWIALSDASRQERAVRDWFSGVRAVSGASDEQARLVYGMQQALEFETPRERLRVIRHLLEILTTEAFTATAVIDYLWGIAWLHGPLRDFGTTVGPGGQPLTGDSADNTLLLSVTGGQHPHSLLLTLLRGWAGASGESGGGFLGVRDESLTDAGFTPAEQSEIWSLVTWRRQTADPLQLFEIAVQRLVHPGVRTRMRRYAPKSGRYNTLWAQPGRTAVPGGKARLFAPSLEVWLPFAEESGPAARQAGERVRLLASLFVPVTLPLQVVWQESVARLGGAGESGGAYLSDPVRGGARLTGTDKIEQADSGDPSEPGGQAERVSFSDA